MDFDVIVIGSGFGGAITACRLAQKGRKILILERGKEWDKGSYPRKPEDEWIWSQSSPEHHHGWMDLRIFKGMSVIQGAGVGGGSLIYANISRVPPEIVFKSGWPPEITLQSLAKYYATVGEMLEVQQIPSGQLNPRVQLMQEAAKKLNQGDRFLQLDLAVTFNKDPNFKIDFSQAPDVKNSTPFVNVHGAQQGTCAHLGECDIGCRVYAKNTLDKNYLPEAAKAGARIWPLHIATNIEAIEGGYRVHHDQLTSGQRVPSSTTATRVIVAAGSLGSTELLLRCRDVTRALPKLSGFLGKNWSSNGDFLTPALHLLRDLWPDRGPTIGSAISYLDGSQNGQVFWIEDGGIPNLMNKYFQGAVSRINSAPQGKDRERLVEELSPKSLLQHLTSFAAHLDGFEHIMPWFAQGVDAGNGVLSLNNGALDLAWDVTKSLPVFEEIANKHKQLAEGTGGLPLPLPGWTLSKELITPHALGGCNMGTSPANGVVDHTGKVFGYDNLYVADGAIVPRALGVNPSRTIGALAERVADLMPE
jgi:cholesterol oxidase